MKSALSVIVVSDLLVFSRHHCHWNKKQWNDDSELYDCLLWDIHYPHQSTDDRKEANIHEYRCRS